MKKYMLFILIFLTALQVYAQSDSAYIIFIEGDGFSLIRNGEEKIYDLAYEELENEAYDLVLQKGDTISTADNTFIEIQLVPSENVIKISENTYFTIKDMTGNGAGTFEITYGSIRSKVAKLLDKDQFRILSQSVVAGVRGTDFGYDITFSAEPGNGSGALANIYCFDGSVEISELSYVDGTETKSNQVMLGENNQISVDIFDPRKGMKEENVKEIDDTIIAFWKENDFSGKKYGDSEQIAEVAESDQDNAVEPAATEIETEENAAEESTVEETPQEEMPRIIDASKYAKGRNAIIAIGFGLELAGAAVYALSPQILEDNQKKFRDITLISMGGVGFATIVGAIITIFQEKKH